MNATSGNIELAHVADLHLEVHVAAVPAVVWQALTQDIGKWWPGTFYCGGGSQEKAQGFFLEAHPGGRMWEDWGSGDGLLWATVINVNTGKTLDVAGIQGPAWGGPSTWFGSFSLEADGAGTKLRFSESGFGRIPESQMAEKGKGWRFLFANMSAYLEGNQAPAWDEFESADT